MNEPYDNTSSSSFIENYEYYFDILDKPLFTPVIFHNCEESAYLKYKENFYQRYHKSHPSLLNHFLYGNTGLEKYIIKEQKFLVGAGTIFRFEVDSHTITETIFPLILICFDEQTNWDTKKNYKIVVNNQEFNHPLNSKLKPKLLKILEEYKNKHNSDIIFTNDVKKYCFNKVEKLKFKSIKEQKEYLNKLVENL